MPLRKILSLARKYKTVTLPYPFKPEPVPEDFRGQPVVDPDACMGCGACANVCPPDAITVIDDEATGRRIWQIFYGKCIFCGRCEEVCPVGAIRQTENFELASKSRADLEVKLIMSLVRCANCGKVIPVTARELTLARDVLTTVATTSSVVLELLSEITCPECRQKKATLAIVKALKPLEFERKVKQSVGGEQV